METTSVLKQELKPCYRWENHAMPL